MHACRLLLPEHSDSSWLLRRLSLVYLHGLHACMATAFSGIVGLVVEVLLFAPFCIMYLHCRPWGNLFVVLSTCFIWCFTDAVLHRPIWSFLSQARVQLVQASNLQFGSLGAVRGDDAERRWWATMGEGGGCWPKAWAGSAADFKAVNLILPWLLLLLSCLAVVARSFAGFCSWRMSKKPVGKPETSVRWSCFPPLPNVGFSFAWPCARDFWGYLRGKVEEQGWSGIANGCTQGKWCWMQGAGMPCPCWSPQL